jgi:hypothetical protein
MVLVRAAAAPTFEESQEEEVLRPRCRRRPLQYLNNLLEQYPRALKKKDPCQAAFSALWFCAGNDSRPRGDAQDPGGPNLAGEESGHPRPKPNLLIESSASLPELNALVTARAQPCPHLHLQPF